MALALRSSLAMQREGLWEFTQTSETLGSGLPKKADADGHKQLQQTAVLVSFNTHFHFTMKRFIYYDHL